MTVIPQLLQDHFEDPYHRGACDAATHTGRTRTAGADCQIVCELRIGPGDVVEEVWFDGAGCAGCEGLASLLAEYAEGKTPEQLKSLRMPELLAAVGLETNILEHYVCVASPLAALSLALESPLDIVDDELSDGPSFGGPSLREEC